MLYTDQLNRRISIPALPQRIISLVPSQTELLVDLGLEDRIVGVTKFCVYPERIRKQKTVVGGTKNYRYEVIKSLNPDLIIGNKEENDQESIHKLIMDYPVWMSDVYNLEDCAVMIRSLGEVLGVPQNAEIMINQLKLDFRQPRATIGSAIYMIWKDPILVAGKMTFIDEMMRVAGFENAIIEDRYPQVSLNELSRIKPEYLLLSSEPYPFVEKHINLFQEILPDTNIRLVDGEMFSWYGSRVLQAKDYFVSISGR
jgi:ABC-type Fe3+-hydroxamate transport system substrate-binding protein